MAGKKPASWNMEGCFMKRYVSTSFWDDEWVQTLSFTEKGLYLYLLTNPLTNIAGVYKISHRRIVFDTCLSDEEVERIMGKFEDAGKAYRYGEFVVIPSWPHHQKCRNSNIQKGIRRILNTLDAEMVEFLHSVGYRYPLDEFLQVADYFPAQSAEADADAVVDPGDLSDPKRLFLHLWKTAKDDRGMCIFQVTATIERPRDWERFWRESPPTAEQIATAFRNFADGISSGAIQRRFIPATPDRFLLRGGISRYQSPVTADKPQKEAVGAEPLPSDKIRL